MFSNIGSLTNFSITSIFEEEGSSFGFSLIIMCLKKHILIPHTPRRGVLKKRKILNLVLEPKLLNMISYKHKDKKKSKR